VWAVALAAASALFAAGCEATFQPVEPAFFETGAMTPAEVVPQDIWEYPRVYYGGTYAYLVGGRWYYPTASGWMVLRREPVELSRERTRIQPDVPRRYRAPSYGYPPEERYRP
jgi:hypothetical protein